MFPGFTYSGQNDVKIHKYYSDNTTPLDNRLTDLPPATLAFVPGGFGGIQWVVVGTYSKKEDKKKGDEDGNAEVCGTGFTLLETMLTLIFQDGSTKKHDPEAKERYEGNVQLYRLDKQTFQL
jgi:hypothetical protein